jgi:hypothetical protein
MDDKETRGSDELPRIAQQSVASAMLGSPSIKEIKSDCIIYSSNEHICE